MSVKFPCKSTKNPQDAGDSLRHAAANLMRTDVILLGLRRVLLRGRKIIAPHNYLWL